VLSFGILVLPKTVLSIWYVFFVDFAITTYKMNSSRHYLACERACHDYEIGVWWKRNDIRASTRSQLLEELCARIGNPPLDRQRQIELNIGKTFINAHFVSFAAIVAM
jgi:hypothetical protein